MKSDYRTPPWIIYKTCFGVHSRNGHASLSQWASGTFHLQNVSLNETVTVVTFPKEMVSLWTQGPGWCREEEKRTLLRPGSDSKQQHKTFHSLQASDEAHKQWQQLPVNKSGRYCATVINRHQLLTYVSAWKLSFSTPLHKLLLLRGRIIIWSSIWDVGSAKNIPTAFPWLLAWRGASKQKKKRRLEIQLQLSGLYSDVRDIYCKQCNMVDWSFVRKSSKKVQVIEAFFLPIL